MAKQDNWNALADELGLEPPEESNEDTVDRKHGSYFKHEKLSDTQAEIRKAASYRMKSGRSQRRHRKAL